MTRHPPHKTPPLMEAAYNLMLKGGKWSAVDMCLQLKRSGFNGLAVSKTIDAINKLPREFPCWIEQEIVDHEIIFSLGKKPDMEEPCSWCMGDREPGEKCACTEECSNAKDQNQKPTEKKTKAAE